MERSELAIIIPAFNEEASLGPVVARSLRFGLVIVVDDASSDRTGQVALDHGAQVVRHERNRGYDAALDAGFAHASALGCRYAVTIDADGQHDAGLLQRFAEALPSNDLVLGVRPRTQRLAETWFAWFAQWRYGVRDPLCGMKGYRLSWYHRLGHFDAHGSIGTELALFAVRQGATFVQVAVPIRARVGKPRFASGLKGNWRIFRALIREMARTRASDSPALTGPEPSNGPQWLAPSADSRPN